MNGMRRCRCLSIGSERFFVPGYIPPAAALIAGIVVDTYQGKPHSQMETIALFIGQGDTAIGGTDVLKPQKLQQYRIHPPAKTARSTGGVQVDR